MPHCLAKFACLGSPSFNNSMKESYVAYRIVADSDWFMNADRDSRAASHYRVIEYATAKRSGLSQFCAIQLRASVCQLPRHCEHRPKLPAKPLSRTGSLAKFDAKLFRCPDMLCQTDTLPQACYRQSRHILLMQIIRHFAAVNALICATAICSTAPATITAAKRYHAHP